MKNSQSFCSSDVICVPCMETKSQQSIAAIFFLSTKKHLNSESLNLTKQNAACHFQMIVFDDLMN